MTDAAEEWAIVELMGHRRRAGRIAEADRFGAKLLRVDVPIDPDLLRPCEFVTEFYGGSAIYALRPCSEEVARAAAKAIGDPRPVAPASYRVEHQDLDDGSDEVDAIGVEVGG